jgi:hypothetical protein
MGLVSLALAIGLLSPPAPACQRQHREAPMTAQECWAWIVMGESGGQWPAASLLVAWTLRAWEVHLDMPASDAGRMWGWYGWQRPNWEAVQAVNEVWDRPLAESPWPFMQLRGYCKRLGSAADVRLWRSMGAWGDPFLTIPNPQYPNFSVNCYLGTNWGLPQVNMTAQLTRFSRNGGEVLGEMASGTFHVKHTPLATHRRGR